MNVLTDKTNVDECTCYTLIPEDIPGAVLKKDPEKCLKSELEWWLKCRGFRVKKSSTRANLCSRVRQCMLSDSKFTITDPDPGQCHIIQKKNLCIKCNPTTKNSSGNEALFNVEKKYPQSLGTCSTKLLPKDGWNRKTANLPPLFNHVMITDHAKSSGKNRFVEKPIEKGYKFFWDGYLYGVTCVKAETFSFVKAKCHRSQRKNDPPHTLHVKMNEDGFIESGTCSCVAGIDGKCNHIFALLYAVDHAKKMKLAEFPLNETCTQKPSEWSKCRTDGVSSDPIMDCRVVKPKYGSSSAGIKPTLYQATRSDIEYPDGNTLLASLKELPGNFGIYSVLNTDTTETIKTRMGYSVLKGSVLSYQVSLMEANFNVVENIDQVAETLQLTLDTVPTEPPLFPWNQNYAADISPDIKTSLKLNLSAEEATDLEKMTREQNLSQKWFAERKRRLTASKFGLVLKRKTSKNEKFIKDTLIGKEDLSGVPAIKYGIDNESKATTKYIQYMERARNKVTIFKSGLFVNPKFSWAGASPDGKVFDSKFGFGLIEVKCAYKHKDVTPIDACLDTSFFCKKNDDGLPSLKKDHHYFSQVQGQMGICGAKWCDFVVYTNKGMIVERIEFDIDYWKDMIEKLRIFYVSQMVTVLLDFQNDNKSVNNSIMI